MRDFREKGTGMRNQGPLLPPPPPLPFQNLFILPPLDTPSTDRVFISDKLCSCARVFRVVAWLKEESSFSVPFANWAELRKVHTQVNLETYRSAISFSR